MRPTVSRKGFLILETKELPISAGKQNDGYNYNKSGEQQLPFYLIGIAFSKTPYQLKNGYQHRTY